MSVFGLESQHCEMILKGFSATLKVYAYNLKAANQKDNCWLVGSTALNQLWIKAINARMTIASSTSMIVSVNDYGNDAIL